MLKSESGNSDSESDDDDFEEPPQIKTPKSVVKARAKTAAAKTPKATTKSTENNSGKKSVSAGKSKNVNNAKSKTGGKQGESSQGKGADGGEGEDEDDVYLCVKGCGFEGSFDDVSAHETACAHVKALQWDDNMDEEDEEDFLKK